MFIFLYIYESVPSGILILHTYSMGEEMTRISAGILFLFLCGVSKAGADTLPSECGTGTYLRLVSVASATALNSALAKAKAGDLIKMADGLYKGNFVATTSGTSTDKITLCGPKTAILDGGSLSSGYTFHLKASHWRLVGFSVTRGKNAIILDRARNNRLYKLTVYNTGNEAVHLRNFSSNNVVESCDVSKTGVVTPAYGEGIYIGSAYSNWCTYTNCDPDKSDNNKILKNRVYGTYAEPIDIKEGTTGTLIEGNALDGSALKGVNAADSWIDVKGNNVIVRNNKGTNSGNVLLDGYQTHVVKTGWGQNIVFDGNTSTVNADGYGIFISNSKDVTIKCNNTVSGSGKGLSNQNCE